MGLSSKHPLWTALEPSWRQVTHCREGEQTIKALGTVYLPATSGMEEDGMGAGEAGAAAYEAYRTRAVFPTDVADAIEGMVGIMHRKPAVITVPPAMEPLLERMAIDGADAQTLLRRINAAQLEHGRLGLMLDVPNDAPAGAMPYVALYSAPSIINWATRTGEDGKEEVALVVLDETGIVLQPDLTWQDQESYLVLTTDLATAEILGLPDRPASPTYQVGSSVEKDLGLQGLEGLWQQPSTAGRTLTTIPFVFVNTQDLATDPDTPPLLGLSNTCLAIYRSEADYRQALFLQGQETLVVIGAEAGLDPTSSADETRVGAGARLDIPKGGDAKYIGVSADGLGEMREGLNALYDKAAQLGMKLLDMADSSSQQSGDALRIRVAARTASLTSVARAGGEALQAILRLAAEWMGLNPEEVTVAPNVDFADSELSGKDLLDWVAAKNQGAPISWQTIHAMLREREVTQLTFDEEQELIEEEAPAPGAGVDPVTGEPLGEPLPEE